jgi:hypothetical protein
VIDEDKWRQELDGEGMGLLYAFISPLPLLNLKNGAENRTQHVSSLTIIQKSSHPHLSENSECEKLGQPVK